MTEHRNDDPMDLSFRPPLGTNPKAPHASVAAARLADMGRRLDDTRDAIAKERTRLAYLSGAVSGVKAQTAAREVELEERHERIADLETAIDESVARDAELTNGVASLAEQLDEIERELVTANVMAPGESLGQTVARVLGELVAAKTASAPTPKRPQYHGGRVDRAPAAATADEQQFYEGRVEIDVTAPEGDGVKLQDVRPIGVPRWWSVLKWPADDMKIDRLATGSFNFDFVLGSTIGGPQGAVPGLVYLLQGPACVGKSTLVRQAAKKWSRFGKVVYSMSGELQSAVESGFRRIRTEDGTAVDESNVVVYASDTPDAVEAVARDLRASVVIFDWYFVNYSNATPFVDAYKETLGNLFAVAQRIAREQNVAVFVIGNETEKRFDEHVDVVLKLNKDESGTEARHAWRRLVAVKNRCGDVPRSATFRMDIDGLRDLPRLGAATPQPAVAPTLKTKRLSTKIPGFDDVLGSCRIAGDPDEGGATPGFVHVLFGEPGVGKSELLHQAALGWSMVGNVAIVASEAFNLHIASEGLLLRLHDTCKIGDTGRITLYHGVPIATSIERILTAKPDVVIFDDLDLAFGPLGDGGGSNVDRAKTALHQIAKETGAAVFGIVGRSLRSPIAHECDVVLRLEALGNDPREGLRKLTAEKNRAAGCESARFVLSSQGFRTIPGHELPPGLNYDATEGEWRTQVRLRFKAASVAGRHREQEALADELFAIARAVTGDTEWLHMAEDDAEILDDVEDFADVWRAQIRLRFHAARAADHHPAQEVLAGELFSIALAVTGDTEWLEWTGEDEDDDG